MSDIIKVRNLSKKFNQFTAVNDLAFTVANGDVYGFLGQNGAGKSTTMRMLLTLIQPTEGNIEMFGLPLHNNRNEILRQVGAVIEKPDVYKYLSAYENLKLFGKLSGIKITHQKLQQQLEVVGLADRANDKVKNFSQGMKQRLGIAIALVHNPALIVLDEPTNGLDPQGIADIRNLILHLSKNEGKTILVSSHLLSEIEQVATKVLIIDKGKKIIEDSAQSLFDPAQTIVEISTFDDVFARQQLLQSQWESAFQENRQNQIVLKIDRQKIPVLHRDLVAMNIQLISLQPRHSLEDYFLQVTTGSQNVHQYIQ
jgi:ABC-type multidrug transport system ATPase subunit